MVLTLDIGNTNIVVAGVTDGKADFIFRLSSSVSRTADEYSVLISQMASQLGFNPKAADGAIISSVVPGLTSVIRQAVETASGIKPLVVGPGVKTGLNIRIDDPSELGADFVAAAVAAIERYPLPCVTIDMGTATAIGVIDKSGSYIGGVIAPGLMVSQNALARGASQLPHVSTDAPGKIIGKNTKACMQSGLVHGSASMLDGLLDRIEDELGCVVSVVASGDWAANVIPHCRREGIALDPELVMRGLWLIYKKNVRPN